VGESNSSGMGFKPVVGSQSERREVTSRRMFECAIEIELGSPAQHLSKLSSINKRGPCVFHASSVIPPGRVGHRASCQSHFAPTQGDLRIQRPRVSQVQPVYAAKLTSIPPGKFNRKLSLAESAMPVIACVMTTFFPLPVGEGLG